MRTIVLLFLLMISCSAIADSIKCYSNGKLIYGGIVEDIIFYDNFLSFGEKKTGKLILVTGDCVIKVDG